MSQCRPFVSFVILLALQSVAASAAPPHISTDPAIRYDYDIVYVRAPRYGDERRAKWADFSDPTRMEPGADLMLLHPDGREELLVSGQDGSVMDPYVSFDGEWVYYAKFIDAKHTGSDIWKMHVRSHKAVRLTDQTFTPNTGAAVWLRNYRNPETGTTRLPFGVFNLGPCPLPGGRLAFTTNRNAHLPPRGYPKFTQQLFVMDDDGANVEQIGYLNIACALHPVILKDGRLIFSSLESEGLRSDILWGIWSMHPDGTNWGPVASAFSIVPAPSGYHFQAQLSDESLVVELYYNLNNSGFGTYLKLPARPYGGGPGFGPGWPNDPRNSLSGYAYAGQLRQPFMTTGAEILTRFTHGEDGPAPSPANSDRALPGPRGGTSSPHAVGKVTHPCGAPDNHLLTAWSPGPANHQNQDYYPMIDSGIYLLTNGQPVNSPNQMRLIKNDPRYNEQWPRPLVPYKRIYGVDAPATLIHRNDGKQSPHLPEGTPFGLVGSSSLYKRESAPDGRVPAGSVTAISADPRRPSRNWSLQGADAGIYDNSDIHAIRILAQEPRTYTPSDLSHALYANHAMERFRILGEIPVRKFHAGQQPTDPDGNPDTSFLAKLPADQSFTFQAIDKDGMVLNMAQTWHQLRPGEIRNDCGGCHAHSQRPTAFKYTAAAQASYRVFDLTATTPLLTAKSADESRRSWDKRDETGLRFVKGGAVTVEYFRDILPILARSCVPCHTSAGGEPAGGLVLDDDANEVIPAFNRGSGVAVTAAYFRLAGFNPERPRTGHGIDAATRYVRMFQSRCSLLVWKLYGRRTDGWTNDDFPSLTVPGDPKSLRWKGQPVEKVNYDDPAALRQYINANVIDVDYLGTAMPPPAAVTGTYKGRDGKQIKVPPLTDEDRRTVVRWIDLGCPIDLDPKYNPNDPRSLNYGWFCDDQRPTLTVTHPQPGLNPPLTRILVGMFDAYTGLEPGSFRVVADCTIDGIPAGTDLANRFKPKSPGVWEYVLAKPVAALPRGRLTVSVKDRQGNISRIERTFSVKPTQ
ncbi:MAG: hypothetical protein U0746_04115 [Gemmataceae bacterium]